MSCERTSRTTISSRAGAPALALVAGAALASCHILLDRSFVSIGTATASAPAAGARRLVVRDNVGKVHVVPSTDGEVGVTADVRVQDSLRSTVGASDAKRDLRVELEGDTLLVANAHLDASDHDSWRLDLEIRAPPGIPWRIENGVGDVIVTASGADVELELGVGDFKLDGAVAAVRAHVGVGSATVDVPSFTGGSLEVGTGDLTLAIRGSGPTQALRCTTGVGNARLTLPAKASANVDLEAGVGSVRLDNAPGVNVTSRFVSGKASGTIGGGGPAISIRTGTGDASLTVAH